MAFLTLNHVKKSFGEKEVLKDVSFSIPEKGIFGFVGENGAGKTTTMKIILGLLKKDGGDIFLKGEPLENHPPVTMGYLPDVPEFYPYLTGEEYLNFSGEIAKLSGKERGLRTAELLSLVGLEKEKGRIDGYSRGMKQRLGIAQALYHRPELLICDEPTSALDPLGRKEILDILVNIKEQTTVLFSTHILTDVERICDEVAFLHEGKIQLTGTLAELTQGKEDKFFLKMTKEKESERLVAIFPQLERIKEKEFYLSETLLPPVLKFLLEQHFSFEKIEKRQTHLEDIFLKVVEK